MSIRRAIVGALLAIAATVLAGCGSSLPSVGLPTAGLGGDAGQSLTTSSTPVTTLPAGDPARQAASKAASGFIAASAPGNNAYKIGPHDVIDVSVFQVPDLSRSAQVSDSGSFGMPLIGEVPAAGKTAQELERDLVRLLAAKYLQKPQVSVMVKEFNSQRVTLEGAVKKPGVYPVRGKMSLLQTIAQAEGFSDTADTTVVVFRQTAQGRAAARFDVSAIRAGTTEDPALTSGDVVVVGTSAFKEGMQSVMKMLPLVSVFALL